MGTDTPPTLLALTTVLPGVLGVQGAVPLHVPAGDPAVASPVGAIGASGGPRYLAAAAHLLIPASPPEAGCPARSCRPGRQPAAGSLMGGQGHRSVVGMRDGSECCRSRCH
jgi:hypothetical protein